MRFAVAPMIEVTDPHFMYLCRLISKRTVLYTEMISSFMLPNYPERSSRLFSHLKGPIVLQLGGSCETTLKETSRIVADRDLAGVNINCGCPSAAVAAHGGFGVALMRSPEKVASLCQALRSSLPDTTPVTVKCRLGVDSDDSYEFLYRFIDHVASHGDVKHFIVHARKALLGKRITPKMNRMIPPLNYPMVEQLKKDFPELLFTLNGGIDGIEDSLALLDKFPGVMVGRAVRDRPWDLLSTADRLIYKEPGIDVSREQVLKEYLLYMKESGADFHILYRPLVNLFHGIPGATVWRREITRIAQTASIPVNERYEELQNLISRMGDM